MAGVSAFLSVTYNRFIIALIRLSSWRVLEERLPGVGFARLSWARAALPKRGLTGRAATRRPDATPE